MWAYFTSFWREGLSMKHMMTLRNGWNAILSKRMTFSTKHTTCEICVKHFWILQQHANDDRHTLNKTIKATLVRLSFLTPPQIHLKHVPSQLDLNYEMIWRYFSCHIRFCWKFNKKKTSATKHIIFLQSSRWEQKINEKITKKYAVNGKWNKM